MLRNQPTRSPSHHHPLVRPIRCHRVQHHLRSQYPIALTGIVSPRDAANRKAGPIRRPRYQRRPLDLRNYPHTGSIYPDREYPSIGRRRIVRLHRRKTPNEPYLRAIWRPRYGSGHKIRRNPLFPRIRRVRNRAEPHIRTVRRPQRNPLKTRYRSLIRTIRRRDDDVRYVFTRPRKRYQTPIGRPHRRLRYRITQPRQVRSVHPDRVRRPIRQERQTPPIWRPHRRTQLNMMRHEVVSQARSIRSNCGQPAIAHERYTPSIWRPHRKMVDVNVLG